MRCKENRAEVGEMGSLGTGASIPASGYKLKTLFCLS